MQKQINLVLNGKGGVGKSFFATNFVQYLKDQQIPMSPLTRTTRTRP
jgi:cellulose biosynthesis protein BcsQ